MRLIDADATVEKLKEYVTEMENDIYYGSNLGIPEDCICEAIEEVPTIEAEPVRHGQWESWVGSHWTRKYDDKGEPIYSNHSCYVCSECRRETVIHENYCPRCGAKMDEGTDK